MNSVLHTLHAAEQQRFEVGDAAARADLVSIDKVDPRVLLHQNNKSIRNLSHSVMKLMAVQQESIAIPKLVATSFILIDRVPVFLEIDAAQMPFPCKILLRPHYKKHGYSPAVLHLISNNLTIYLSTRTKNPSSRNHQMVIKPPARPVFSFSPLTDKEGLRDIFLNKIYVGVYYDLSAPSQSGGGEQAGAAKNTSEANEEDDEMSHIHMIVHASFPKDKEELRRKKLEAMMKKIQSGESSAAVKPEVKLETGKEGEKKIREITQELSQYYLVNKPSRQGSPSYRMNFVKLNRQTQVGFNSRNENLLSAPKGLSQDHPHNLQLDAIQEDSLLSARGNGSLQAPSDRHKQY